MPIIMGLYFAILYSPEVKENKFLWFNLGEPDMIMMLIAGAVYFVQARVSLMDNAGSAKEADENVHLFISNYDYVYFVPSNGSSTTLLGGRGNSLIFQTYLGRKLYFKEVEPARVTRKRRVEKRRIGKRNVEKRFEAKEKISE